MPDKRVLVLSMDGWNDTNGSDFMVNLFKGYGADKVANLYLRAEKPCSAECSNYFRISEGAVIKSVLKRGVKTGFREENGTGQAPDQQSEKARYSFFARHRWTLFLLAREIAWALGRWKTGELDEFVDSFAPEVVVFPIEGYIHFNRIARYVAERSGARAIGFMWDDNFTYKSATNPLKRLLRFFVRRSSVKTAVICEKMLVVSPKAKAEVDEFFGVESEIITKEVKNPAQKAEIGRPPYRMIYAGKLAYGRDETLAQLAEAIELVNRGGKKFTLDIYTMSPVGDRMSARLNRNGASALRGAVRQSEIARLQKESDFLVFAEAVSGRYRYEARLSMSTKVTDYLGAGRCIFAVGAPDVAPMEYLEQNGACVAAHDFSQMVEKLLLVAGDRELALDCAQKALELGRERHNAERTRTRFWEIIG